jgi:leucine dehydrogenase
MKACAKLRYGSDSLNGKKILVQGVGHVGEYLVEYLSKEGAKVLVSDIHEESLSKVASKYGAIRVGLDEVYDLDIDIYAPCALGGTLNSDTLDRLKCDIVAGAANNQLKDENLHGEILREKEIIYAPDFAVNAGGVINCFSEVEGLSSQWALDKAQDIYDTIYRIVKRAQDENTASHLIAMKMAQEKIDNAHKSL